MASGYNDEGVVIRLKGKLTAAIILAAISIIGGTIYYASSGKAAADRIPVAEVNGAEITAKEFMSELQRQRASVIDSFRLTYGAEYGSEFWKTDYNGETPESAAKQKALDELVRMKVELALAQKYGLVKGTTDVELRQEMDKENKRREAAVKANQPIFGPVQLDENSFRNVYMSKIRNELKEKLSEKELKASDEDMKNVYEQLKETLFTDVGRIRFQKLAVSYKEAGSGSDEQKQAARKHIESALQLVKQGEGMSEAAMETESGHLVRYSEEEWNANTAGSYFKSQPALFSALSGDMKPGEVSGVIDEEQQGEYALIKIMQREADGYTSLDDNEGTVRNSYLDSAYTAYLNKLIDEAKVQIIPENYDKMTVQ
ncbi:peptidylprolyl isomerase [Paenibacillus glycanilyticus]|uniref:peptidylprolyl isomerase n=1 Tax=Paenibacillus glycanilyticus TaxID=126569 RepID=A0ABQ6GL66_9BACL|nr:SurA N-terminal domain-containing protein [Paenibacillus glycanilyticus]GLX70985.1 hypothetical protein MU1_53330 [Paenibacillus glycanilyticus]